jgi:hypothetical protein
MENLIHGIGKNIWIRCMEKRITKALKGGAKGVVITDIRFENEAKLVKDLGGIVIKVVRPQINNLHTHSSEELNFECDYIIINDGTIEYLYSILCKTLGY